MNKITIIFAIIICFVIGIAVMNADNTVESPTTWYSHDIEMIESGSISSKYSDYIKENLRDPSSYEFISANYLIVTDSIKYKTVKNILEPYGIKPKIDSTMIIEISYRARNGFGGMNIESSCFVVTPTKYTLLR